MSFVGTYLIFKGFVKLFNEIFLGIHLGDSGLL